MCLIGPPGPLGSKMGVMTHMVTFKKKIHFSTCAVSMTLKLLENTTFLKKTILKCFRMLNVLVHVSDRAPRTSWVKNGGRDPYG